MRRSMSLSLLGLACAVGAMASTSQRVGPTPAAYSLSLRVADTAVCPPYPELAFDVAYPIAAELLLDVRNAQGQPVDGVPVAFQIDPAWVESTSISPQRAITRSGKVRVVLQTTSVDIVRFVVRVDQTVQEIEIAVTNPGETSSTFY